MLQTGIQSCEVLNRRIVFRGEERMSGRPHYQFVARYMFVFLVVAAITASDQATGAQNISAQSKPAFAPDKMETILYGVAYYPEYMPYDRLDRDVELMQKAGITVVRVGESMWSTWEPHDGDFQFAWMQRVLDRLHAAGIKAIRSEERRVGKECRSRWSADH